MATQAKEPEEKPAAPVKEPAKPEFQVDRDKVGLAAEACVCAGENLSVQQTTFLL